MSFDAHANLAYSTVLVAPSPAASGTTLTVQSGHGTRFPAVPFNATVWAVDELPIPTNAEIVRVTNIAGDVLTITRTQESTSARSILVGDQIAATITNKVLTDIEQAIPSTAGLISAVNVSAGTTSNNLSKLTFSNSNGVSFGLDGSTITATVATNYQSQGAYLTTAMQSDAVTLSNLRVSAGTTSNLLSRITFADSNGIAFGLNASTITASYTVPTVTAGSDTAGMSNLGNTSGTTGVVSGDSIRLLLAGGNNITLSQSINGVSATITISGPNAAGAQTGISGVVVSDTTYTSGTISFSNQGNVTIGSSVNGATQYVRLSVAAQSNQSAIKGFGVSNTGQTAGNTGISTGIDWVLAGSQSITLSQSTAAGGPDTVWFQHPAWLTTAMLSNAATISNINISGGTTSSNLSAFKLIDSQGVSWSLDTGSKVYATVKTDYLTSQSTQYLAMTLGGNTAGTTTFHATNNASLFFNGGNNITLSGNGSTVTISAAAQTNQSAIKGFGVSNTGQTAGNTGISTGIDWVLAGSQSITLSQSTTAGGPDTVWIQHPAWLTTADLSANSSKYAQEWALTGNTAGTTSSAQGTRWYFSGGNNLTISGNSNTLVWSAGNGAQVNVSAGTTSNNLGSITFADSNGISFGLNASTVTASANTVGTATTVYSVASANSVGTVTRWAAEDHRHAGVGGIGISTSGNTAGTTGSELGTYWLQGGQSITLSQITSNNGSHTLVISGPQDGYQGWIEPYAITNTALFAPGAGSWYLAPFTAHGSISGGRINFLMQNTGTAQLFRDFTEASVVSSSTGAQQQGYTYSLAAAIFSQGTGSNSTRLESKWSNSFSFGWTKSVSVSSSNASQMRISVAHTLSYIQDIGSDGAYTLTSYTNSSDSQVANSSTASNFADSIMSSGRNIVSGSVMYPIGFNTTFSAGMYWLGFAWSTTRSNASTGTRIATALDFSQSSMVGISRLEIETLHRNWGSTATTNRSHFVPYGLYTAAANMAPPTNIALSSDLSLIASMWVPYFNFQVKGLTK